MNSFSKWLTGLGIMAAIVLAGLAVGWLATRDTTQNVPAPIPGTGVGTQPSQQVPAVSTTPTSPGTGPGSVNPNPLEHSLTPASTNLATNWDERLDDILASETDDTNKVKQLFELFPRAPEEGQVELAQHLSNLVEDDHYSQLGKLLTDAKLPESVLDVLMADLLNRPNGVKLPMFLELARNPDHAKAEEGKELLELYLDEDYGTDWAVWDQKLKEWMKENPD